MNSQQYSKLSFVIPVKDEQGTIGDLAERVITVVDGMGCRPELIFIDDGSTDNSWEIMSAMVAKYPGQLIALKLRRNFGKAVALEAGFQKASGDVVFTMDADLQDDPNEIPRFIEELNKGYDLISGWKVKRHDPLSKTLPSKIFNKVTSLATGINLHDFNCGFKCFKKEIVKVINIYGELHRYMPVLAHDLGYKVGEIGVEHHPRQHGFSKYGWERYIRGFIDLVTVLATTRWLNKPGHLFGGIGVVFGVAGSLGLLYLTALWLLDMGPIGDRPLLMVSIMFSILSIQMISLGVIAEFFVKAKQPREIEVLVSEVLEEKNRSE